MFGDWGKSAQRDFLLKGEAVSSLKKEKIVAKTGQTFTKAVEELFANQGGSANSVFGEVMLDYKGVKNDVNHGMGVAKNIAFASVKDVLEKGTVILPLDNHNIHGKKQKNRHDCRSN